MTRQSKRLKKRMKECEEYFYRNSTPFLSIFEVFAKYTIEREDIILDIIQEAINQMNKTYIVQARSMGKTHFTKYFSALKAIVREVRK